MKNINNTSKKRKDLTKNMGNISDILSKYIFYKRTIQNCSPKTVDQYILDLTLFFRFLISEEKGIPLQSEEFNLIDISGINAEFINKIKTEDIYKFFNYAANERGNKARARARKLSSIKSFYKYLKQQGIIAENIASNIEGPSTGTTMPKYLDVEESIALLDAVKSDKSSRTRERDYAIITLFLNCGIRLSELVGINISNIDRNLRSMRVIGKGNKERIVYLNDACRDSVSNYLNVRPADIKPGERDALFISSRGQRISHKTVQWMVYKYLSAAGLGYKRYSTHKLRHTAATLMYQSGKVDVRVLKDILGHEQLNTTQIYTHVSDEGMEKAMGANPLASINKKKK